MSLLPQDYEKIYEELAQLPEFQDDTKNLKELISHMSSLQPSVPADPEFKAQLKSNLLTHARRDSKKIVS